jgi:hypothetical protein
MLRVAQEHRGLGVWTKELEAHEREGELLLDMRLQQQSVALPAHLLSASR